MSWDTSHYFDAHASVIRSQSLWENEKMLDSVGYSISARLSYLSNMIVNVISFPLAIIAVTFGSLVALVKWDWKHETFTTSYTWIKQKTNHVLLSAFGMLAPSLAYKYRDANLAPYVIALRIIVISSGFFYAFSR